MQKTILASAFRAHRSREHNEVNHKAAGQVLDQLGLLYKVVTGSYREDGQETASVETSYMISVTNLQDLDSVLNLFFVQFQQEAALFIDREDGNKTFLLFSDQRPGVYLGEFREVSAAVALASECYTLIDGKYFQALEPVPAWGECSQSTKEAEPEKLHDADRPDRCYDSSLASIHDTGHLPGEGRRVIQTTCKKCQQVSSREVCPACGNVK